MFGLLMWTHMNVGQRTNDEETQIKHCEVYSHICTGNLEHRPPDISISMTGTQLIFGYVPLR